MKISKQIFKEIKNANTIVIARHIGPDPDAVGAQVALREILKIVFPKKNIYALGSGTKKLSFLGEMDHVLEADIEHDLLIVLDTPNISRIDGINTSLYKQIVKIDHHPLIEDFNGIEWIDEHAFSTCQMLIKFLFDLKLPINEQIATNLYVGVMADTNRFLYLIDDYRSIDLVHRLLEKHPLMLNEIHQKMYEKNLVEWKFRGYLISNMEVTKHGLGYVYVTDSILKEHKVDVATPGNTINEFNNIKELPVVAFFTEDVKNRNIRVSIRSNKVVINKLAEEFGGGGHKLAAGARLTDEKDINKMVTLLDKIIKDHKEEAV